MTKLNLGENIVLLNKQNNLWFFKYMTGGLFEFFDSLFSTLFHIPPLRIHFVKGCWDRTQDCCDIGIVSQTLQPLGKISSSSARSHPNAGQISSCSARSHPTLLDLILLCQISSHSSRSHPTRQDLILLGQISSSSARSHPTRLLLIHISARSHPARLDLFLHGQVSSYSSTVDLILLGQISSYSTWSHPILGQIFIYIYCTREAIYKSWAVKTFSLRQYNFLCVCSFLFQVLMTMKE